MWLEDALTRERESTEVRRVQWDLQMEVYHLGSITIRRLAVAAIMNRSVALFNFLREGEGRMVERELAH